MELHLGFMKNKELAAWFGVKEKTFLNTKKKRLEELKEYAEITEARGGVIIDKILNDNCLEYVKNKNENLKIIEDNFRPTWNPSGLDSCSNVSMKIYNNNKDTLTIAESTTYKYTIMVRDKFYGKPFVRDGELGSCIYVWCKKVPKEDGNFALEYFSEEELRIKDELMEKFFKMKSIDDKIQIKHMVDVGELTKEEAYDLQCELENLNENSYKSFLDELRRRIGYSVVRGTQLIDKLPEQEFLWFEN